jgi:hypothetical protein
MVARLLTLFSIAVATWVAMVSAAGEQWTPQQWKEVETLNLCTTGPKEGVYCFPVWLVVLDDSVYVRLGNKATERVQANTTGMLLPVDIGGHRFERVQLVDTPDMADRVSQAMADKYWSDIFVRFFPHPLTLRLQAEPPAGATAEPGH